MREHSSHDRIGAALWWNG